MQMERYLPRLQFANKQIDTGNLPASGPPWRLLIVDDEAEVHTVTELSLRNLRFDNRPIEFLHAYSGAEARRVIGESSDIHLVLLDVVMETDDAGLQFVDYLREEIADRTIRIVLRTGQPGLAPESEIIHRYDINDYRLKTDLTHQKLMTSVVAALRGHNELSAQALAAAEAGQARLRKALEASGMISRIGSGHAFFGAILRQVSEMLGGAGGGLACAAALPDSREVVTVLAASGSFTRDSAPPPAVLSRIAAALAKKESVFDDDSVILYIRSPISRELAVFCDSSRALDESERLVLGLFAVNAGVSFDNLEMVEEMLAAQVSLEDRVEVRTRELVEQADRFRGILDDCPAAIVISAPDAVAHSFTNAAFAAMMGVTPDVALTLRLEPFFVDPDDASRYRTALQEPGMSSLETQLLRPSGEAFWVTLAVSHMTGAPSAPRVTWLYDVSASKAQAETLERMVREDDLTGVASRKQFIAELGQELKRARRYDYPLSVMMIDIDRFKEINDHHGHAAGDEALRCVARCAMMLLRDCDLIGRVGGDEFAVLLRETPVEEARQVGERLRQALASAADDEAGTSALPVTISIGLSALDPGDPDIETLLHRADAALYRAKREGRDRLVVAAGDD